MTLSVSVYMVAAPAHWVRKVMQLSKTSTQFKLLLIGLGVAYLVLASVYEKHVSLRLAKLLGRVVKVVTGKEKERKKYKVIDESMRT